MRFFSIILFLGLISFSTTSSAQPHKDGPPPGMRGEMISKKMKMRLTEYLHQRLKITDKEAEKFDPLFSNYLDEMHQTMAKERENLNFIERQQKILSVSVKYRDDFATVIGMEKANMVFEAEREFRDFIRKELEKRREERGNRPPPPPRPN